jgi:hypothetical protein
VLCTGCRLPRRSATDQRHVGYESWLERDHLAAFDFDPAVVAIASQPFWLLWMTGEGKSRSHAPDFFLRRGAQDAVSLVPGSVEVGYVAGDGSARRVALTGARAVWFEATAPGQVRQMADASGGRAADDGHDAAGSPLEPIDAGRNALLSRELDCHLPAALIRRLLGPFNYGCGHRALAAVLSGCLTGTMPSGRRR